AGTGSVPTNETPTDSSARCTAPSKSCPLTLHDALPIWWVLASGRRRSMKLSEAITNRARKYLTQPTPRPTRRRRAWRVAARARPAGRGCGAAPTPADLPALRPPHPVALRPTPGRLNVAAPGLRRHHGDAARAAAPA